MKCIRCVQKEDDFSNFVGYVHWTSVFFFLFMSPKYVDVVRHFVFLVSFAQILDLFWCAWRLFAVEKNETVKNLY